MDLGLVTSHLLILVLILRQGGNKIHFELISDIIKNYNLVVCLYKTYLKIFSISPDLVLVFSSTFFLLFLLNFKRCISIFY